jgi:hypothetical protein
LSFSPWLLILFFMVSGNLPIINRFLGLKISVVILDGIIALSQIGALVIGIISLVQIAKSKGEQTGRAYAILGICLSIITLGLYVIPAMIRYFTG